MQFSTVPGPAALAWMYEAAPRYAPPQILRVLDEEVELFHALVTGPEAEPDPAPEALIVAAVDVPCQVAGGIRDADAVAAGLAAGADRLVLGSALISSPLLARTLTERYGPDRIVAALDVREGQALGDGWVEGARGTEAVGLARALAEQGIRWFAVTAIARDGQMSGPDYELLESVRSAVPGAAIIASAGVSSLADVRELAARGFEAAIIGRALYEGAFTLAEGLAVAAG